jgi:RNA polymerase sigma factor (sigma-70 family)
LVERVSFRLPAFETFVEANRTMVERFLIVAVGPEHADDVFQETFLAALRAYPRCTEPTRLDRWVLRIASRKAIDHHRRRAHGFVRSVPVADVPDQPGSVEPEPADTALWAAVDRLAPKQRIAVIHRYVLDRPYDEIAELLGCSEDAARANVSAGVKRLRERL